MKPTPKHTDKFYRKRKRIDKIVKSKIDKHEVIYGARAINKQVPPHLRRPTTDFDIFSKTPKKDAREVERALDRRFGGDFFFVEPAKHRGTWKVKAHATGEG